MTYYSNVAVASGKELPRKTVLNIIKIAFNNNETKFARHLAYYWLDFYPGDLDMQFVVAKSLLLENNHKKAHQLLKQIVHVDPTHLEAVKQAIVVCKKNEYPNQSVYEGLRFVLSNDHGAATEAWAQTTKQAFEFYKNNDKVTALSLIQSVLEQSIPTPLPAIYHLMFAENELSDMAFKNLLTLYSKRWSDAIAIKYLDASYKLNHGQESQGVSLLHQCVQSDISGSIAKYIWGDENPYQSLWDEKLSLSLNMQIPASIAATLGWNQLTEGNYRDVEDIKDGDVEDISFEIEQNSRSKDVENKKEVLSGDTVEFMTTGDFKEEIEKITESIHRPGLTDESFRNPVYLVISSKAGLVKQYGEMNFRNIKLELENLTSTTCNYNNWKAKVVFVDDLHSTQQFGLSAVNFSDPWEIKTLIADIDKKLEESNQMISALLIVGGHNVIPFHFLPNPVLDQDTEVYTDSPYATLDENYYIPTISTGRMPGDDNDNPVFLINMIKNATNHRLQQIQTKSKFLSVFQRFVDFFGLNKPNDISFGASTQAWRKASQSVYRTINKSAKLVLSPPTTHTEFPNDYLSEAKFAHFNVHGVAGKPNWYGEKNPTAKYGEQYPTMLVPANIVGKSPAIVFSEACFGANVISHNAETSMALKFLSKGTNSFIGSTCVSYGAFSTPLTAADLLAQVFWKMLLSGFSTGDALRRAKIHLVRETHRNTGYMDNEDQKTIISFNLFGDPLTSYNVSESTGKNIIRETVSQDIMCSISFDVVDKSISSSYEIPEEVLMSVKKVVKAYLPGFKGAKVKYNPKMIQKNGFFTHNDDSKETVYIKSDFNSISLSTDVISKDITHHNFAHLTLDKNNKIVKICTSK